jgi:deazaflavin-dependent oxidoreductase (nitroreductase family)
MTPVAHVAEPRAAPGCAAPGRIRSCGSSEGTNRSAVNAGGHAVRWFVIGMDFAAPMFYAGVTEIDREKLLNDPEARKTFNDNVVQEFRANGGMVSGPFSAEIVLLTTTGAKSGQPRLSPLAYFTIEGKMLVVGSFGGAPKDPAWVRNLRAKPGAHVEVGTESYDVIARELPRDERDAVFDELVELAPVFADHQAKTSRVIPVFELRKA